MEEAADIPPPLWPQNTTGRHLRRTPSVFLNSDAFIIFLLIISLCFIFIVIIPPFHYFTCQFFRPQSEKKSGDFLSLVLVLFAIACGFLSRNKDGNPVHDEVHRTLNASEQDQMSNPSIPHQWHEYSDRTGQNLINQPSEVAVNEHWRISGGPYITNYPFPSTDPLLHCQNLQEFEEELDIKRAATGAYSVYQEETFYSTLLPLSFPPLPPSQLCPPAMRPPTPPRVVERKVERINEAVGHCEDGGENYELSSPTAPPPLAFQASEDKISINKKKRCADGEEFCSSLKRRKKKKKQRQKNVENNDILGPQYHYLTSCLPPAPPPPRIPPPLFFHHLTSTNLGKTRTDCLVPQQPSSPELITSVPSAAKTEFQNGSFNFHGTPLPSRTHNVNSIGRKPPFLPLPPPCTTPKLKIVMHGDYFGTDSEARSPKPAVRVGSKSKKANPSTNASSKAEENADEKGPMFCPSPDVNSKADSFIERFRAGLKLERMNSIKERQRKRTSILAGNKTQAQNSKLT